MKIFKGILIVFTGLIIVLGFYYLEKSNLELGIDNLNSGNYEKAKLYFDNALKKDKNNNKAKELKDVIVKYEEAKKEYNDKNYEKAKELVESIPEVYSKSDIRYDISNLRKDIDSKIKEEDTVYINRNLGIKMDIPKDWKGKYYVHEERDSITFIYKSKIDPNITGILIAIDKIRDDGYTPDLDEARIICVKGKCLNVGTIIDKNLNAKSFGDEKSYNEYIKMKEERDIIYNSIREAN